MRKTKWFFLWGFSALLLAVVTGLTIVMVRLVPAGPGFAVPDQADAETYADLSLQLAAQRHWAEAAQINQKALSLQPYHPTLHYNQAWLAARQGQWQQALTHFDKALALAPEHAAARLNRAWVYQQLGQAESARRDVQLYQKLARRDQSPLEQARIQQLLGEHAAAITGLTALIAARPDQLDLYYWRSRSLLAQNRVSEAMADLDHLLQHQPEAARYAERAEWHLRQNAVAAAAADFERSLLLKEDADVRLALARSYLTLGRDAEVLQQLQVVKPANDTQATAHAQLQTEIFLRQGNLQGAAEALTRALEQMPQQGALWLMQARLQRQKRQYAAAEQAIQKAAALGYRASRVMAERAMLAAQRGQREQARAYLRAALQTEPALNKDFQNERLLKPLLD